MYCRKCGHEIDDDSSFCPYCREEVVHLPPINPINNEPEKRKNFKKHAPLIFTTLGIVLLVAIFAISYFAGRCDARNCNNKAQFGDYCAVHVCKWGSCTSRAYNDGYCSYHYLLESGAYGGTSYSSVSDDLKFSEINISTNSSYTICTGRLTNKGNRTYTFVKVKGTFESYSGTVYDTDWTYAVGSEGLAPGESVTFRLSVDKDSRIKECNVTIIDYD